MKLNKLWAAAALALALVSCKNEPAKEPEQQKMKYPVALSLDGSKAGAMRATEKSNSLSASNPNERAIENLTVVVFLNNNATNTPVAVEKVITYDKLTKPTDPYQGEFKFDMGMAGTYQLEVIANGYKDDSDKDAFINQFKQGVSYDQFKNIVYERALPNNGETGFAMLSAEPTKVTTLANETAHAGTIKLRRLACRFDVYNKLTDELKLTKVTLQNQTDKSYLMTQGTVPDNAGNTPKEYTKNGTWFTPTLVSAGIYSYENPVKGAVKLQLEGEYKGQAWEKTIELRDRDGNYIATQRNHIYRVLLTKGDGTTPGGGDNGGGKDDPANADKINYVIEVLDWDEDASMDYEDNDVWNAERRSTVFHLETEEHLPWYLCNLVPTGGYDDKVFATRMNNDGTEEEVAPEDIILTLKEGDASRFVYDSGYNTFAIIGADHPFSITIEAKDKKNGATQDFFFRGTIKPLEYVSYGSINSEGNDFGYSAWGYFSLEETVDKFNANFKNKINTYHLPTLEEWAAVLPYDDCIRFNESYSKTHISNVVVGGNKVSCKEEFFSKGDGFVYAKRFMGTDYQSVWMYTTMFGDQLAVFSLQVNSDIPFNEFANSDFWEYYTRTSFFPLLSRRYLYFGGIRESSNVNSPLISEKKAVAFWASPAGRQSERPAIWIDRDRIKVMNFNTAPLEQHCLLVRLFSDKPLITTGGAI